MSLASWDGKCDLINVITRILRCCFWNFSKSRTEIRRNCWFCIQSHSHLFKEPCLPVFKCRRLHGHYQDKTRVVSRYRQQSTQLQSQTLITTLLRFSDRNHTITSSAQLDTSLFRWLKSDMTSERRAVTRAVNQPFRASLAPCSARSRIFSFRSVMLVCSRAVREHNAKLLCQLLAGSENHIE